MSAAGDCVRRGVVLDVGVSFGAVLWPLTQLKLAGRGAAGNGAAVQTIVARRGRKAVPFLGPKSGPIFRYRKRSPKWDHLDFYCVLQYFSGMRWPWLWAGGLVFGTVFGLKNGTAFQSPSYANRFVFIARRVVLGRPLACCVEARSCAVFASQGCTEMGSGAGRFRAALG